MLLIGSERNTLTSSETSMSGDADVGLQRKQDRWGVVESQQLQKRRVCRTAQFEMASKKSTKESLCSVADNGVWAQGGAEAGATPLLAKG